MPQPDQSPEGFVRAYHLTTAEHAASDISLRRLKIARFSEVNDPFELLALNAMPRQIRPPLAKFRRDHDQTCGLLCFSRRWKNPVLWSHYAAGGRGIGLGFDIRQDLGTRGVLAVRYESEKLRSLDGAPAIRRELQDLLLVTKFKHWEYEEELRVVVSLQPPAQSEGEHFFYPFSDDGLRLRRVILGPLCPRATASAVRALVRAVFPDVMVIPSRLGFKYFEVKPV